MAMLRWIFIIVLMAVAPQGMASAALAADQVISGERFRVVDGDTVHIGENKIRLLGIDAPERRQTCAGRDGAPWACGQMATAALTGLLEASETGIACAISGKDRYQRLLGRCYAGQVEGGIDVQRALVLSGFAVAEYADTYRNDEAEARRARRGIWAGTFLRPREWRRAQRQN